MASDVQAGQETTSFVAGPSRISPHPTLSDCVGVGKDIVAFEVPLDLGKKLTPDVVINSSSGNDVENSSEIIKSVVPEDSRPVPAPRKRRHSSHFPAPSNHNSPKFTSPQHLKKRRKTAASSQPMKFLMGGNSTDPLNLNSLVTGDPTAPVVSPYCSPAPRNKDPNPFLIPKDITDPLNIKSGDDKDNSNPTTLLGQLKSGTKKKKRHSHRKRSDVGLPRKDLNIDLTSDSSEVFDKDASVSDKEAVHVPQPETTVRHNQRTLDKIVSPVLDAFDDTSQRVRQRRRKEPSTKVSRTLLRGETEHETLKSGRCDSGDNKALPRHRGKDRLFQYGNYNQYYGKRNPEQEDDFRLKCFCSEWFKGKDVLDIGCNIGHVSLTIGRDFEPRKITGIDIDGNLISIARKNIRHYLSPAWSFMGQKFPISADRCHGPIAAPPLSQIGMDQMSRFPNNVMFKCCNYVLEKSELLSLQKPEYDVIMCLSVTKWIHLNFGDAGLKRTFRRMYVQLRPGGRLILEPQSWQSYAKKKKVPTATLR